MGITESSDSGASGLYLLFAKGKRPDRAAIRGFASSQRAISLTHDPEGEGQIQLVANEGRALEQDKGSRSPIGDHTWLELLRDGLTFDLIGLAPGQPAGFPEIEHRFDFATVPGAASYDALRLMPGHHLRGGGKSVPVVKALIGLACDLACHFTDLEAVVWPPSRSVIGRRFFESVSTAWIGGGAFPALGLTAFRETVDGALQSVGLEFWIDQEIRIEPPLSSDKVAATRLGVRLVNQLILLGGIDGSERIVGPDGARLLLTLSRNNKFIRVSRE